MEGQAVRIRANLVGPHEAWGHVSLNAQQNIGCSASASYWRCGGSQWGLRATSGDVSESSPQRQMLLASRGWRWVPLNAREGPRQPPLLE